MSLPNDMIRLMRLIEFSDSAFPVGTFSFSNSLETASFEGIVYDKNTLHEFTQAQALQAAFSDGVAALHAFRAVQNNDYTAVTHIDRFLFNFKMNTEARLMNCRMGKKLGELTVRLFPGTIIDKWLNDIKSQVTPGMYPIGQGLVFAIAGIGEKELFCSHQYGVVNMVVSAALRCVKVSHYDTQEILFSLSDEVERLYQEVSSLSLEDMNAFYPQLDILASLHEKGNMRMFMN
ncbi:MAG: urease accessory protein UreF [Muribaculaceae bacterium]|nr:urease accessory protein UreF [Muribaculaceae bacterium]